MKEVTQLLVEARDGDASKLGQVFEIVYPELKRLASARTSGDRGSPVTTTALVHSTYLKLIRAESLEIKDRQHFFGCAARAMRQIFVDQLRAHLADKRGGGLRPVTLPGNLQGEEISEWIDLDRALGRSRRG